jgi:hypothetical protein
MRRISSRSRSQPGVPDVAALGGATGVDSAEALPPLARPRTVCCCGCAVVRNKGDDTAMAAIEVPAAAAAAELTRGTAVEDISCLPVHMTLVLLML